MFHNTQGAVICLPALDLLDLSNAIVDVIAHTEDDFTCRNATCTRGSMNLINEETPLELSKPWEPATIISGGSAANYDCLGAASLGLRPASSARFAMTAPAIIIATTCAPWAPPSTPPPPPTAPPRRAAHPRHAGWRAHHEHLSRRLPGPGGVFFFPPRPPTADVEAEKVPWAAARSPISKVICGTRRTPRTPSRKAVELAHCAGKRVGADAFRFLLRRPYSATSSSA